MAKTDYFKTLLQKLFLSILILSLVLIANKSGIFAAPAYNYTTGMWSDTFSDNTGLATKTNVNTNSGSIQLTTNDGLGGFVAPFYTSGTATSIVINPIPAFQDYINPNSIAHYDNLNIHATLPAGTAAMVQLLNGNGVIASDFFLSGNSNGFNLSNGTTTIDITNYNSGPTSTAKFFYIYLKTNLSTTDTNVTPTIDRWEVTWTTQQGDLSATTLANSAWPMRGHDLQGTNKSQYSGPAYPTFKYFKKLGDLNYDFFGYRPSTAEEVIDSLGNLILVPGTSLPLLSIDKASGSILWSAPRIWG